LLLQQLPQSKRLFLASQMKQNRITFFIALATTALVGVLIIQFNWILETAKVKEEIFTEKANMILSRTTEALGADTETCQRIDACMSADDTSETAAKLGDAEIQKIDSLFNYYMRFYNFHIDYTFEIVKQKPAANTNNGGFAVVSYDKTLANPHTKNGMELKLIFPDKTHFILAEMGTLFITSVVLILVVLILFWLTITSLLKQKKISEHTTDFLNNMTHEFKTPLSNISLAGKLLTKDTIIKNEEKIKHYSGIILEENEKLRLQVEQVLSMTALERGEIPILKTELDFHTLINDALKHISLQIENRQGHLNLNLKAHNFNLNGDKMHLINALCNLIDNAIKYAKDKPEISITTTNAEQNLILVVADKGIGISKQYSKKVFDKFFRVPTGDVHDVKGFGLGLAYVKKIIELHCGKIELQSEKGDGTTFTITLPNA
jgi:two-component system phosphate regulon sensor histidine kinase PhoR